MDRFELWIEAASIGWPSRSVWSYEWEQASSHLPQMWFQLILIPLMNGRTLLFLAFTTVCLPQAFVADSIRIHTPSGENVWGRGTSDDKNGLIGILYA